MEGLKNRGSVRDIVKVLVRLDEKSLLLIDSGAKLLAARQEMDEQSEKEAKEA